MKSLQIECLVRNHSTKVYTSIDRIILDNLSSRSMDNLLENILISFYFHVKTFHGFSFTNVSQKFAAFLLKMLI